MQIHYDLAPLISIGLGHQEAEALRDRVFHIIGLMIGAIEIFV